MRINSTGRVRPAGSQLRRSVLHDQTRRAAWFAFADRRWKPHVPWSRRSRVRFRCSQWRTARI